MIKISKKDSIIDVIIKINNCKQKEVVLDFPFGHPIIHNYTSLKILKNKCWKKDIIIITNDKTAQLILKKLWIKYSKLWDPDLLEYNYTFFEYWKYLVKRYFNELIDLFSNKTHNITFDYHKKNWNGNSKIWFFIIWLIISLLLFSFVFYFAVNKTYIYITPEISIKTRWENFVFREWKKTELTNNNVITLSEVSKLIYFSRAFWTSWVDENTLKNSTWKATFYNELPEDAQLLKWTRVQTDDWIIYTANSDINIPKATKSSKWDIIPWSVIINITSKNHDNKWNISWDRANIWSWVLLSIPWLKTDRDKIYAKTLTDITWWNKDYVRILSQEDIDNAKEILEWKLKQLALNELKKQIKEDNHNNNVTYEILWVDDILKYSDLSITWEEKLKIWEKIDNFELSWTIKITSYIYNKEKLLNQLSNTIKWTILEEVEKLMFIDSDSLRISNVMNRKDNPIEIKATAQVEAFFTHNFLNEKNNYVEKLKTTISWMNKDEALKTLLNNPNISDVKIEIRPFFMHKVSKMPDNIIIKVVEKQ